MKLEGEAGRTGVDDHGTVVCVVDVLAPRFGVRVGRIDPGAAVAYDEIGERSLENPLIEVIVAGEDGIGTPGLEGPLHLRLRTMTASRGVRRVVHVDDLPWRLRGGQLCLKPLSLNRVRVSAVGL